MRACAGTPPTGTEVNGRATRVHDFLGLRLASARCARGAPTHVPSGALPAARAELGLSAVGTWQKDWGAEFPYGFQQDVKLALVQTGWPVSGWAEAKLGARAAGDSSEAA